MTPSAAPESTARPRAAARPARVFAQGRFETLTLLRNGEQLLVSVVLPAMALVGLTLSPYPALGDVHRIDVTAPGVLALAVASTAFTGQAISTAFDRRYGVLRMYGVSPLGRSGLLMGKLIAVGAVLLVQGAVDVPRQQRAEFAFVLHGHRPPASRCSRHLRMPRLA